MYTKAEVSNTARHGREEIESCLKFARKNARNVTAAASAAPTPQHRGLEGIPSDPGCIIFKDRSVHTERGLGHDRTKSSDIWSTLIEIDTR